MNVKVETNRIYVCSCGREYATANMALACERNHKDEQLQKVKAFKKSHKPAFEKGDFVTYVKDGSVYCVTDVTLNESLLEYEYRIRRHSDAEREPCERVSDMGIEEKHLKLAVGKADVLKKVKSLDKTVKKDFGINLYEFADALSPYYDIGLADRFK